MPLRIGLSVALLVVVIVSMDDIDWDELPDWNSETAIWSIGVFVFTITGFILLSGSLAESLNSSWGSATLRPLI